MSTPKITQQNLLSAVDALVASLMAHMPPVALMPLADQLEGVLGQANVIPPAVSTELCLAIKLVRDGQPCPAVSALLAARSRLSETLR